MLLLFETSAGLALFKVLQENKLEEVEDLHEHFNSLENAQKVVKLKAFSKFENTTDALATASALVDSKMSKGMKKFLKKNAVGDTLAVLDAKLGNMIKEKLEIPCVYSNAIQELARGVRSQLQGLISGLMGADLKPMSLGLSHSLSRYKLKFSPDKVDTMVVQAIGLLDDLDKELNTYAMRVREWYGWHFPEMGKVVSDNIKYAKAVKLMGTREKAESLDMSELLEEEVESQLKDAAKISMGTEISEDDLGNIQALCDQVIELSEYRAQLYEYLKSRMQAIAPNLTILVGELVGARLIAHAGTLMSLAKHPASTVQILGAEKALFRALKAKHETPKYGLIYHASLIGQAAPKHKGKISRLLAAKCALAIRVDALGESDVATVGIECRAKVEARLRQLEGKVLATDGATGTGLAPPVKYDGLKQADTNIATQAKDYNPSADVADTKDKKKKRKRDLEATTPAKPEPTTPAKSEPEEAVTAEKTDDGKKKKKKKSAENGTAEAPITPGPEKKKVKSEDVENGGESGKKKKKKKEDVEEAVSEPADGQKKKKKKKSE